MKHSVRIIFLFLIISYFTFPLYSKEKNEIIENLSLMKFGEFLLAIDAKHPEIKLDKTILNIAHAQEEQSGYLADPMVNITRENMPLNSLSKTPTANDMRIPDPARIGWNVSISQQFPWFGTLSAEKMAAQANESISKLSVETQKMNRKFAAANLFLDFVALKKMWVLQIQNKREAEKLMHYAELNFSSQMSSHQEIFQFHNDLEFLKQEINITRTQIDNLQDEISFLIGQKANFADFPSLKEIENNFSSSADLTLKKIVAIKESAILKNESMQKNFLPKITTTFQMMRQDNGMVSTTAMLGINIPIYSPFVRSQIENEKSVNKETQSIEKDIYEEEKAIKLKQIDRKISLLENYIFTLNKIIIPNAKQHLKSGEVEYSKAKAIIFNLLKDKKSLIKYQFELVSSERAYFSYILQKEQIKSGILLTNISSSNLDLSSLEINGSQKTSSTNGEGM